MDIFIIKFVTCMICILYFGWDVVKQTQNGKIKAALMSAGVVMMTATLMIVTTL
jgi:hypothetical protein